MIGDRVSIGFRCLLDARAGIAIGDDVVIASDVHIIAGGHDINHPSFLPAPNPPDPIVIDDHVWIGSRAMILPSLIGRGAVVGAHAVVINEVPRWRSSVAVPAKVIGQRNPDALQYSGKFRGAPVLIGVPSRVSESARPRCLPQLDRRIETPDTCTVADVT